VVVKYPEAWCPREAVSLFLDDFRSVLQEIAASVSSSTTGPDQPARRRGA